MKIFICISFFLLIATCGFSQWVQTSGPSGGGVSDFAFVQGKILTASFDPGNGVFASTDDGVSWHESGLQGITLKNIASNGNTVIVATTSNSYNETDTVFRSGDGGVSWQKVTIDFVIKGISNINGITSICYHKQKWFLSAQGQKGGMFVSTDDGMSWTSFKPALFNFSRPVTILSFGNYLIAGTDVSGVPEILRSQNDGQTWIQSTQGAPLTQVHCGVVSANTIWLGAMGGVIFSSDSGNSWTHPANKGLEHKEDEYMTSIAVSGNHLVAVSSLNNIYYSWDGGGDWTKYSGNGLPSNASYFFSATFYNGSFLLGASTGILRSSDGGTLWQYSTDGLKSISILELASHDGKIFAATERGVSFSPDHGASWHDPQNLNDLNDIKISGFLKGQNSLYAYGAGLYSWGGSSWNTIDIDEISNLAAGASGRLFASRQSADPIEGTGGIYFSDNGGNSWQEALVFKNTFDTEYYFVQHCMASHDANIVAIQRAFAFQTFTPRYFICTSSNNGLSWNSRETIIDPAFVYYADNEFYMGGNADGLFRSVDNGITWQPTGLNPASDVTALIKKGTWLFASVIGNGSMTDGIYGSEDDGASWRYKSDGTHYLSGPLATDGMYLYTGGPAVWRRPLGELGVNEVRMISSDNRLQVFPNPAHDLLHIQLNSVNNFYGSLVVVDEKGSVIFKKEMYAASDDKNITVFAGAFSNGSYYVKLLDKNGLQISGSKFIVLHE